MLSVRRPAALDKQYITLQILTCDLIVGAGLDVAGLLKHQDDIFCYVAHRDGVYHPIFVESEGPAAAAPLVHPFPSL